MLSRMIHSNPNRRLVVAGDVTMLFVSDNKLSVWILGGRSMNRNDYQRVAESWTLNYGGEIPVET